MVNISEDLFKQFEELTCRLSPENLHCDGEISRAQANRRYREIMKEWKALEAKVGHPVSVDEIEAEWISRMTRRS